MKLTTFFLFAFILQVSASGFAQQLTIRNKALNLKELFSEIKQQTGYNVVYQSDLLEKKNNKIRVDFIAQDITTVLAWALSGQGLDFAISDKTIVIRKGKEPIGSDDLNTLVKIKINGQILDDRGKPLSAASVKVKGTNISTSTGNDGRFVLDNVDEAGVLEISYVGFATIEEPVRGRTLITVRLQPDQQQLEELVIVGYGAQKKVNLTGAVDQVGAEVFENRPMPSTTRGLQGVIPNLNIRMTDGKPTRGATYNVRGTTSLSGGSALVMIDGVAGDPNLLNPNDIESVTVLKDAASAAIYGARGAFGVVLITTKSSKSGTTSIRFNSSYTLNEQTTKPDMVWDGYTWAKMFLESFRGWNDYSSNPTGVNNAFPFSLSYLDSLKYRSENPQLGLPETGLNPTNGRYLYFGNTNWLKELYKGTTPSLEQNISISKGTENLSYYISGRYYKQAGVYRYNPDDFNKYNFRAKGEIKLNNWLSLSNNLDFSAYDYREPMSSIYQNQVLRNIADQGFPMAVLRNPDGSLTQHAAFTLGDYETANSSRKEKENMLRNTVGLKSTFLDKRVNINADFTYMQRSGKVNTQLYPITYSNSPGIMETAGNNFLREDQKEERYFANNIYGDYRQEWGKHSFKGLLGYNLEYSRTRKNRFQRDGLLNPELPDFSLMDGLNYTSTGGGADWAIFGAFYRLNYIFDNRYLFEFNGRYDGSSRFPQDQRFAFFPSASAGWRVSEEQFLKPAKSWLNELKLRASYGSMPNGDIDEYLFLTTLGATRSPMLLDGVFPSQISQPAVLPNKLTWETSTTLDLGIDVTMLRNRLGLVFDWYSRRTTDMFTALQPLPRTFGATVPKGNNADLETKGWELSLNWKDQIGANKPLGYNLRLVLADQRARITKFNNPTGSLNNTYYVGMRLGEIWGYTTEGLFQNVEEIRNHANQNFLRTSSGNNYLPGDVKFKDLNGDGVINNGENTIDNPGDRSIIGNSEVRYTYGLNIGLNWNGFSLDAFFQGIGKRDWWPGTEAGYFWGQYNRPYGFLPQHTIDNAWSPENPDAYFPRYRGYLAQNATGTLRVEQTRYLQDASYIRLKNLTIGYTIPKGWMERVKLSQARLFLNAQNLWTYSPMYKVTRNFDPEVIEGADPEINEKNGNGYRYPMLRSFTFGLDITF